MKLQHSIVGLPDRILLMPGGRVTLIEFKARQGRVSRIQMHWLAALGRMGFRTVVIRNVAEFDVLTESTE